MAANRENGWRAAAFRGLLLLAVAGAVTGGTRSASASSSKQPGPETRLPFDALGIPPLSANFLSAGASMLTLNFIDDRHLLVTFGSRGLVPRLPDDPEGDQDRVVTAKVVELPGGKVLMRTQWHLHDHGRYLWPLGNGRFMLRIREELSTFAPLENFATQDPWVRTAFAHRRGDLQAVQVSSESKLLTLMTAPPNPHVSAAGQSPRTMNVSGSGDVVDRVASFVYIDFYRMGGRGSAASPMQLEHAGAVRSPEPIRLAVNGDGYLRSQNGGRGHWKVSFESYEGASRTLAPVGSGCPPGLDLLSRGQWLAFTCRNNLSTDSLTLQAYDFAGHELWEEPIGSVPVAPSFAYAPEAGRFAMSRLLPAATSPQAPSDTPSAPTQELRVYQTQSGDLLLKVNITPTFRTAENYDLSPDGLRAAVVHDGELDIYRLPDLSKADKQDLEDVQHMLPPANHAPINLRKLVEDDAQKAPLREAEDTVAPPAAPGGGANGGGATGVAQTAQTEAGQPVSGDTNERRKPPTLLNPGESPEFKGHPQ